MVVEIFRIKAVLSSAGLELSLAIYVFPDGSPIFDNSNFSAGRTDLYS